MAACGRNQLPTLNLANILDEKGDIRVLQPVRLSRDGVRIDCGANMKASLLETAREAASAAE